jgi:hypothetical protein
MFNTTYNGAGLFVLFNTSFLLFKRYKAVYLNKNTVVTILSETDNYIEQSKNTFLKTMQLRIGKEATHLNSNTNQEFYSKQNYQTAISADKNPLEIEWKHRILFENTPRGNVIMYYDPYKLAFAYYCDTSSMSYKLLNAIAMKYVIRFHCVDLFVDNEVLPVECVSPLIKTLYIDEPVKNKPKPNQTGIDLKNAPFVKLKKYDTSVKNTKNKDESKDEKKDEKKRIIHNNFVCIGKIINFSFISKVEKRSQISGFKSNLLDNLTAENNLQKQVLSYKDFKGRSSV